MESRPNVAANVIAALREGNEPIDLVLSIRGREGPLPFYRPGIDDPPERRAQVLDQVLEFGRDQVRPGTGILVERRRFPSAGNASITADAHAIARLASHPLVSGLAIAARPRPLAAESVQLTQFPPPHALGYTGSGIKVAIIDSRFDPALLGCAAAEQHCSCRLKGGAGCCPGHVDELHDTTGTALPPAPQPMVSDSKGNHRTNVARMIAGGASSSAPHVELIVVAAPDGEDSLRAAQWLATRPEFEFDDGRYGVIPLTRLLANVNCTAGGGGAPGHPDYQLSGNWYRGPGFGGQGLIIEVNPVNPFVFGTWYTFVPATDTTSSGVARQRWFSFGSYSPVSHTPGQHSIVEMPLVETTRGRFNQPEPEVSQRQVGTATLTFDNCAEAELHFHFNPGEMGGMQGDIDLRRVGGVIPPGCNF